MEFRLAPNVNTALMSFFLNSFQSLGPRIGTHGNFVFSVLGFVLIVTFWFTDVPQVLCSYVSQCICHVHSLWKCLLKNLFHSRDAFQYIFCMLVKEYLWILPLRYVVLCLSLVLSVHLLLMFSERFWNHKSY